MIIIFTNEFNIYCGYPRSDTCATCDSLTTKISSETVPSIKEVLEKELEAHKTFAEDGYNVFRNDQRLSRNTWSDVNDTYSGLG